MDVSIASSQRLFRGFGKSGGRRILVIGFTMIHGGTRDMYIQIYIYIYIWKTSDNVSDFTECYDHTRSHGRKYQGFLENTALHIEWSSR